MKKRLLSFVFVTLVVGFCANLMAAEKLRVFVLTDINNEPDDAMSLPKTFRRAGTLHLILAVTDNGTPALTRYQRVIVEVKP